MERRVSARLNQLVDGNGDVFDAPFREIIRAEKDVPAKYAAVVAYVKERGVPLYLVVDEYDNFTNALIRSSGREPYRSITHGTGFYRAWFKYFKGDFDRIFMTGVSPVTMET